MNIDTHKLIKAGSLFLLPVFLSCALVNQKLDPTTNYRKDIQIKVNDRIYDGVAILPKSNRYEIKIRSRGKLDLLTFTTCHREEKIEKPSSGFWSSGKDYTWEFKPIQGIEDKRGCLLDIGAFEQSQGRHSWGLIDFETDEDQLPATVLCDGKRIDAKGVSICQARAGLIQEIHFSKPVIATPKKESCQILQTQNRLDYKFLMPIGDCVFHFVTKDGEVHRLTTYGYDGLLIRSE